MKLLMQNGKSMLQVHSEDGALWMGWLMSGVNLLSC